MERGYNECSMEIYNQGRKQGEEQARLECCVRAIERNMASISEAAEIFGVDETKLADYIQSCGGGKSN